MYLHENIQKLVFMYHIFVCYFYSHTPLLFKNERLNVRKYKN